jgi:hypothetical protein
MALANCSFVLKGELTMPPDISKLTTTELMDKLINQAYAVGRLKAEAAHARTMADRALSEYETLHTEAQTRLHNMAETLAITSGKP